MAHSTANRAGIKRNAARLRALRRRAAAWKRAARRAMTLAVVAGSLLGPVHESRAQMGMGQSGMGQAGGLVNGAVTRLQNGPGWMYYGINAADRGLGYLGSYMTAGGFIPVAEDDLGGLWSTDLRGHLSNYGGFFSNVGAVRKQFIGGTLLGVGVYWDYDGDQNQYSPTPIPVGLGNVYSFAGGQSYNQVGVSGEWLTDWGNLRSNGYIPVGTTAQLVGPFLGNAVLCQNGVNAALSGADLEVGAYIPGLSDWAGMVSVGGYAYGNDRYKFQDGSAAVPWFGGVYTRLDMTFIKNWDFSLQYNNDSYFDSTGFARLTYRMGGSRRRNVPDQVEQPMMRNEHIVRAHQTPIVAINPVTNAAWNVIHVDNSAAPRGNGTAETPVQTLAAAQALATNPYDIVFVRTGNSATTPYASNWLFQADNQILVGQGSTLSLNTATCGYRQFFATGPATAYPVLTSSGTAITLRNGAIVDHFRIENAPVGILASGSTTPPLTTVANVNDVQITTGTNQVAVFVDTVPSGEVNFYNMNVTNAGLGLWVGGGAPDVKFQGLIMSTSATDESVLVQSLGGGSVNVNTTTDTLATPVARNQAFVASAPLAINDTASAAPAAIQVASNNSGATVKTVNIGQATITRPTQGGVLVQSGSNTQTTFTNLNVVSATNSAFVALSSDTTSSLTINGRSSLQTTGTAPTFDSNDDSRFDITLVSLQSGVTGTSGIAVSMVGQATGTFRITDQFLVSDGAGGFVSGTTSNVANSTTGPVPPGGASVSVTLPP